jgi:CheY-like chemotaxis protein
MIANGQTAQTSPPAPVVLIADDDPDVRASLEEGLRDAGFDPHCVILLDLFMPVMNGWNFVHHLRGTCLDKIPIILVTGSAKYWGSPVERVLRKPLDLDQVVSTLDDVLTRGSGAAA